MHGQQNIKKNAFCMLLYTYVYTAYTNIRIRISFITERATFNTGHCAENAVLYNGK